MLLPLVMVLLLRKRVLDWDPLLLTSCPSSLLSSLPSLLPSFLLLFLLCSSVLRLDSLECSLLPLAMSRSTSSTRSLLPSTLSSPPSLPEPLLLLLLLLGHLLLQE